SAASNHASGPQQPGFNHGARCRGPQISAGTPPSVSSPHPMRAGLSPALSDWTLPAPKRDNGEGREQRGYRRRFGNQSDSRLRRRLAVVLGQEQQVVEADG